MAFQSCQVEESSFEKLGFVKLLGMEGFERLRDLFDKDRMLSAKLELVKCIPEEEKAMLLSLKDQTCEKSNMAATIELAHKYGVAPSIMVQEVERLFVEKPQQIDFQQLWDLGWPRRPLDWPDYQEQSCNLLKCLVVVEPEQAKRDFVKEASSKLEKPRVRTLKADVFGVTTTLYHDRLGFSLEYPTCEYVNCQSLAFYTVGEVGDVYVGQVNDMKALVLVGKMPTDKDTECAVNYDKTLLCLASREHVGILSLKDKLGKQGKLGKQHDFQVFDVACKAQSCKFVGKTNLLALFETNQVSYFDTTQAKVVARFTQTFQIIDHAVSEGVLGVYTSNNGCGSLVLFGLDTNVADTNLPGILNGGAASTARIVPTKGGFKLRACKYGPTLDVPSIKFRDYMKNRTHMTNNS